MPIRQILITGGTGSFGKAFLSKIVADYPHIERIVVFSRDELKQWELQQFYPEDRFPQLRFFLGDVRDRDRQNTSQNPAQVVCGVFDGKSPAPAPTPR